MTRITNARIAGMRVFEVALGLWFIARGVRAPMAPAPAV
jgi:hypothetical protein